MCNRFRLTRSQQSLRAHFVAEGEFEERPRYNIAPTQPVLIVRREHGQKVRQFKTMRWGLIPSWAKDSTIGTRTLNARSETVRTLPACRESILKRRCLIPADGFYEWQKIGSVKQPYCFEVGEGDVFALAGLWDEWRSPDGEIIESCTILTTSPNALVADLHNRMPVIVAPEDYDRWLDPDITDFDSISDLLKPFNEQLMHRHPVSRDLNNSKNDDATSAAAITLDVAQQKPLF